MSNFDFYWNYRIVNAKTDNGGDDWYCLREVVYVDGKPAGHTTPCVGSECIESFKEVWSMMEEAMKLPPLQEEDFVQSAKGETA